MKRLILALLLTPLFAAAESFPSSKLWQVNAGGDGPGAGKRIVLVSGDEEYRSEEALPQLAKILSIRHGFDTVVLFGQDPVEWPGSSIRTTPAEHPGTRSAARRPI